MTPRISLKLALLTFLAAGGCAQILGISDYDVDPKLDPDTGSGQGGGAGGEDAGEGGSNSSGQNAGGKAGTTSQGGGDQGGGDQGGSSPGAGAPGQGGMGSGGEGGQPPQVVVIDCDSVECCDNAGGIVDERELLDNVGFELGQEWWGESSDLGYDIIVNELEVDTINAHAGEWFTWLGGDVNELALMLTPTLDIPADTGWVTLSGWRFLVFDSTTLTTDYAQIQLFEEGIYDVSYEDIFLWDSYADDTSNWTSFEISGAGEFYAGLPLQLSIIGVTDDQADDETAQAASNFFFDDVSFTSSRCIEP